MKGNPFRLGWLVAVVMLTALACTCGPLNQATQGVQTAQALASQAQGLATQAEGLATQVEQSGFLKTAEAAASQAATSGTQAGLGQVPDDIPIYSDHSQVVAFDGTIGYQAKGDLKTVTEFYQTEMVNKGWEQSQDPIISDSASILSYKKGDKQATINLAFSGGVTAVGIQVAP